ncbi:EAL domain-containing protein [Falsiroseomonas oryziterrae]|uniref:EAL domain-containing protein n=1 Tax=Falsiroseomonas oryziterrae TaxID=2911368 RepID=UPI001F29F879|nr:EAL domain-containing protein [Roseomonas sp. NPKOSM-4]
MARRIQACLNGARAVGFHPALPAPAVQLPSSDPADLAAGLARGEITVRFQPMVRLADRRPVAVEALARWERPELALGAGAFVPMAERAGLAGALTLEVARRAIAAFAAARGPHPLHLSFNVPLDVLLSPDLGPRLRAILDEAKLAPSRLLLELTESTHVRDAGALRRALLRLGQDGFGVLLDDFSLDDARQPLLDLPFVGIKLDRSVIAALPRERRARALVERLARHAERNGLAIVAEGISSPSLWRCVAALGCDLAQGFGVGRPMQPEALPAWVAAWSSLPAADQAAGTAASGDQPA